MRLPVLNSSVPSGVSTATSSSVISTLAWVPRLASFIAPADCSRCAGRCDLLEALGALVELLGLDRQKVAARIDADVVELGRLPAQLLRHLHVALEFALVEASTSLNASRARE